MSITQKNLDTLHTAQLLLIVTLDTQFSDIVTGLVVLVFLYIGWRHLSNIAQNMGGYRELILAHAAFLYIEPRETEHLLLKEAEVLV